MNQLNNEMPQLSFVLEAFWPRNVVKRGICYQNVCPSVCLSHSWITSKRFKISKYICFAERCF